MRLPAVALTNFRDLEKDVHLKVQENNWAKDSEFLPKFALN